MKKKISIILATLCLCASFAPAAFAAQMPGDAAASNPAAPISATESVTTGTAKVCYPTAVSQSEDKTEIRKMYDLSPEDDPAGIPRSDFVQDGYSYTLTELLKQELPEQESRSETQTLTVQTKNKDMASILAVLPSEKEFITEDGLKGNLKLQLESVNVDVSGYGSSEKALNATRTYPGLSDQDTSNIPKSISDGSAELTLQSIDWQADAEGHFTATASYAGSTTSSYVKGYTVTADYTGTVSRIALNRTRYVAIYEGKAVFPIAEVTEKDAKVPSFNWAIILVPVGIIALAGAGIGIGITMKRRSENEEDDDE